MRTAGLSDHFLTAQVPDNRTHDEPMIVNQDGLPHFLIHGLNKEDNYTILVSVSHSSVQVISTVNKDVLIDLKS